MNISPTYVTKGRRNTGANRGVIKGAIQVDLQPMAGLNQSGMRRALRIGLNRAASPVKGSVVTHAQAVRRYGDLGRSIRIRIRNYPQDRFVTVIGASMRWFKIRGRFSRGKTPGAARFIKPWKYGTLVEGGTRRSRAKRWLKPAHDATKGPFLESAAREIGKEIDAEILRQKHTTFGKATNR